MTLPAVPVWSYDDYPTAAKLNALGAVAQWCRDAAEHGPEMQALPEAAFWSLVGGGIQYDLYSKLSIVHVAPYLCYRTWSDPPGGAKITFLDDSDEISLSDSPDGFATLDLSGYDQMREGTAYILENVRFAGEYWTPYA